MKTDDADPECARSGVGADAHSERQVEQFHIRKILLHLVDKQFQLFRLHQRVGDSDFQDSVLSQMGKAGGNIIFYSVQHCAESGFQSSCLGVRIQLVSLDGQNGLQLEHCADGSGSGCDPSAFLQIFQSVYSDVDAGIQRFSLQDLFDL